jgi:hypothetical protein
MAEHGTAGAGFMDDPGFRSALLDHQRKQRIITGATIVGCVLVSWIPLQAVAAMVDALAGEETSVDLNFALTVSIAFSLTLVGVSGALLYKMHHQRKELVRLRQQLSNLESKVPALDRPEEPT